MNAQPQPASFSAHMAPVLRKATFRPETVNRDAYTIDVVWTTGAVVREFRFLPWSNRYEEFDEELLVTPEALRLDRLNSGAPFLDSHNDWSLRAVLGTIVSGTARIEDGKGLATIQLSRTPSDADVVQKIQDGIIRNVSVRATIHKIKITEREGKVPHHLVTDWEPKEISAVPIGADPGATTRGWNDDTPMQCQVTRVNNLAESVRSRMRIAAST